MNIIQQRRSICEACEHYNKQEDTCEEIIRRGKGRGSLNNQNGIANPRISCPILNWKSVPSRHAHLLALLLPEIDGATLHRITQRGLHQGAILKYVCRYYRGSNLTRTQLMDALSDIANQPNDYEHLRDIP